jgi:hypothetical protein
MEYVKTLEEKAVEPNIIDTDPNPTLEQLTQDNEKKRRQYKECKDESKLLRLKIGELETKLKPFERLAKCKRRINDDEVDDDDTEMKNDDEVNIEVNGEVNDEVNDEVRDEVGRIAKKRKKNTVPLS